MSTQKSRVLTCNSYMKCSKTATSWFPMKREQHVGSQPLGGEATEPGWKNRTQFSSTVWVRNKVRIKDKNTYWVAVLFILFVLVVKWRLSNVTLF